MDTPAAIGKLAAMLLEQESRATEVARLLHDGAGQTLTAVGFELQALGADSAATAEIRNHLEQAMENLRIACNKLQYNVVQRTGLALAVELLVGRIQSETGLKVNLRVNANHRFPAPVAHAVYRVIELALDNVVKHSGADRAEVLVESAAAGLTASVSDQGRGFDTVEIRRHPPGTGLILMESYSTSAHLHLTIHSEPGRSTIVRTQTF